MRIRTAKFVTSLNSGFDIFNTVFPEIAVVGRSNVGKSSFINMIADNHKLSRVSQIPGKTRLVNYFLLNDSFYLVDLPGYGFANLSKDQKTGWDAMLGEYFQKSQSLKAVLLLLDIRREPTSEDFLMLDLLKYYNLPYVIVATKADKVAKSKRKSECVRIQRALSNYGCKEVIPVSSFDGTGKEALMQIIGRCMEEDLV
jgi:GTP-binding protein